MQIDKTFTPLELHGSNAANSRFGFSMFDAGDVDHNGYNDVIIGAPGEEMTLTTSGAVYVYYSSIFGLSLTNKQVRSLKGLYI